MKSFALGLVCALLLVSCAYLVRTRIVVPMLYLNEVVVRTPDGKEFTRAQVLDAMIVSAVKSSK